MKKLLILTSILTSIVFAGEVDCESLYESFVKRIPNQTVTYCKVKVEGSTDVYAMYFKMDKKRAVLLYSSDHIASIYTSDDSHYVDKANCIKNGQHKISTYYMTSSEIAVDLLSHQFCEDDEYYWIKLDPVGYYNSSILSPFRI